MINRRSLITGLVSFAAVAPAIVRAGSLMPVKVMDAPQIDEFYRRWVFPHDPLDAETLHALTDWTPHMRYVIADLITTPEGQLRCVGVHGR